MRLVKLMIPMVLATAILGCSGTKQHKDASWTQKPASMNVLFTEPVVLNKEKDSEDSKEWTVFPWFYTSANDASGMSTFSEKL